MKVHVSERRRRSFLESIAYSPRVHRTVERIRAVMPKFTRQPLVWEDAIALLEHFGLRVRVSSHIRQEGLLIVPRQLVMIAAELERSPWGTFVAMHELAHFLAHGRIQARYGSQFRERFRTDRTEREADTIAFVAVKPTAVPPFPSGLWYWADGPTQTVTFIGKKGLLGRLWPHEGGDFVGAHEVLRLARGHEPTVDQSHPRSLGEAVAELLSSGDGSTRIGVASRLNGPPPDLPARLISSLRVIAGGRQSVESSGPGSKHTPRALKVVRR